LTSLPQCETLKAWRPNTETRSMSKDEGPNKGPKSNSKFSQFKNDQLANPAEPATTAPKPKKPTKRAKKRRKSPSRPGTKASRPATKAPKPGTPEFKRLCAKWYAKLKETGFKDLERPHPKTGFAGPDSWLNAKSLRSIADDFDPKRAAYFRRLTHFVTHRGHAWHEKPFYRFAARLYVDGYSYRQICKAAKAKGHLHGVNVYAVWRCVRLLEAAAEHWWAKSVHGAGADVGD
jgi:hypothetical protein